MFGLTPYNHSRGPARSDDFLDLYNMIDGFFNDNMPSLRGLRNESFKVDVKEKDTEYIVEAELPGFDKDDIKLHFDDGKLLISTSKQEEKNEEGEKYIHKERYAATMQRGIYLQGVDSQQISARFENGVLKISLPKMALPEKKTQIAIE